MKRRFLQIPAAFLLALLCAPFFLRAQGLEEKLGRALEDSSFKIRLRAAILVGKKQIHSLAPKLQKALGDEHDSVRAAAALSLGRLGAESYRKDLVKLLAHDKQLVSGAAEKGLIAMDKKLPPARYLIAVDPVLLPKGVAAAKGKRIESVLQTKLARQPYLRMEAGESKSISGERLKAHLKARKLKGMVLRPRVLELSGKDAGGTTTFKCKISIMLVSLVKKRMEFASSGEAEAAVDSMDVDFDVADDVERQLIEGAVGAALSDISGFLARRQGP